MPRFLTDRSFHHTVHRLSAPRIVTNLPAEMRFEPGDVLIALGTESQLKALTAIAASTG